MSYIPATIVSLVLTPSVCTQFCPGTCMLWDGRVFASGGSGNLQTSIYDWNTDSWSTQARMNIPRGYNVDILLADGRSVATLGGSWRPRYVPVYTDEKLGEVWTQSTGWRVLPGWETKSYSDGYGSSGDSHIWLFPLLKGLVFQAGPSPEMHFYSLAGTGSMRSAGMRLDHGIAINGVAVMFAPNKIFCAGGVCTSPIEVSRLL